MRCPTRSKPPGTCAPAAVASLYSSSDRYAFPALPAVPPFPSSATLAPTPTTAFFTSSSRAVSLLVSCVLHGTRNDRCLSGKEFGVRHGTSAGSTFLGVGVRWGLLVCSAGPNFTTNQPLRQCRLMLRLRKASMQVFETATASRHGNLIKAPKAFNTQRAGCLSRYKRGIPVHFRSPHALENTNGPPTPQLPRSHKESTQQNMHQTNAPPKNNKRMERPAPLPSTPTTA